MDVSSKPFNVEIMGKSRKVEAGEPIKRRHGPQHKRDIVTNAKRLQKDQKKRRNLVRIRQRQEKENQFHVINSDEFDWSDDDVHDIQSLDWPHNIETQNLENNTYYVFRKWVSEPGTDQICIFNKQDSIRKYYVVTLSENGKEKFDASPKVACEWFINNFLEMKNHQDKLIDNLIHTCGPYNHISDDDKWNIAYHIDTLLYEKTMNFKEHHLRKTSEMERCEFSLAGFLPFYITSTINEDLSSLWDLYEL